MGEVTIRLNRLGLEQGRMWPAFLAAVAILLPVAVWLGLERALGESVQTIDSDEELYLQSYPVGDASLDYRLPGDGWTSPGIHFADQQQRFTQGQLMATVEVDSGVKDLQRLLERRAEPIAAQDGFTYRDIQPYEHDGLTGFSADILGIASAGTITVVGNGKGAAAILILIGPVTDPGDGGTGPDGYLGAFRLEGK